MFLIIYIFFQKSLPKDPTYVGAVVEYFPCSEPNNQTIAHNVANYREFIKQASEEVSIFILRHRHHQIMHDDQKI